ncbi:hypothetical protein [Nonomuraea insulae]|uniref:Secreted protein n=1 Tax=Nonomuraea insulae TaxID=1616787 RepID=A0ABW1DFN1_9ACTN
MRRILTAFGLSAALITVAPPVPSVAQAKPPCDQEWDAVPGDHRDGQVRVWRDVHCKNMLGHAFGDDRDWGDGTGEIKSASNVVSSVMNNGNLGGYDVVAFYDYTAYDWRYGYTCLKPGQFYADSLENDEFTMRTADPGKGKIYSANDAISSHKWVTQGDCTNFLDGGN